MCKIYIKQSVIYNIFMFYLINVIYFCEYGIILNFKPAKHYKQIDTGATQNWKSCGILKSIWLEHSTGKLVNW